MNELKALRKASDGLRATLSPNRIPINDYLLSVKEVEEGLELTVRRAGKEQSFIIPKGEKGETGAQGEQGFPTVINGKEGREIELTIDDIPDGEYYKRSTNDFSEEYIDTIEDTQSRVSEIESFIPEDADEENQLADKEYVDNAVRLSAARYISAAEDLGTHFASISALKDGPWYYAGKEVELTKNDYAIVNPDNTHDNKMCRYVYLPTDDSFDWFFQFVVNDSPFTDDQIAALESGATAEKIAQINSNANAILIHRNAINNPHKVTKSQVDLGNVDNIKQYSASNPPPYPVRMVNGKSGDVTLNATDVGAIAKTGGTMTGELILSGDSSKSKSATTKQYVDNRINSAIDYTDEVMNTTAPYIGTNGNWWVWNKEIWNFVDSGTPARGEDASVEDVELDDTTWHQTKSIIVADSNDNLHKINAKESEVVLSWDGNTEGLYFVRSGEYTYYRISNRSDEAETYIGNILALNGFPDVLISENTCEIYQDEREDSVFYQNLVIIIVKTPFYPFGEEGVYVYSNAPNFTIRSRGAEKLPKHLLPNNIIYDKERLYNINAATNNYLNYFDSKIIDIPNVMITSNEQGIVDFSKYSNYSINITMQYNTTVRFSLKNYTANFKSELISSGKDLLISPVDKLHNYILSDHLRFDVVGIHYSPSSLNGCYLTLQIYEPDNWLGEFGGQRRFSDVQITGTISGYNKLDYDFLPLPERDNGTINSFFFMNNRNEIDLMSKDTLKEEIMPTIGVNGNWQVDGKDTGVKARGEDGNDHTEAENARASAESARESAEQSRVSAEDARAASENERANAENARATAENSRASAEHIRVDNESSRQSAESQRVSAEQNRVNAESARAYAESARINASASAVNAANAAAERANEAAEECDAAAAALGQIIDDSTVSAEHAWSSAKTLDALCPPMEVSGNQVVCYPVAGSPLNVTAHVEPVQSGSGNPAPDNVRPISVPNSMTMRRCGKNLANIDDVALIAYTEMNGEAKEHHGLSFSGGCTYSVNADNTNGKYIYAYVVDSVTRVSSAHYYISDNGITSGSYAGGAKTIAVPNDKIMLVVCASGGYSNEAAKNLFISEHLQVELGSSATEYEQFVGNSYEVALPEGFAGGSVDVTGGAAKNQFVRRVLRGTDYWMLNGSSGVYTATVGHLLTPNSASTIKCSHYPTKASGNMRVYTATATPFRAIYIYDNNYSNDLDAWKAYLEEQYAAGTPVVMYYEMDGTTETAIEPVSIPALPGCNTLTTDAQGLTVVGKADPIHIITDLSTRLNVLETAIANS